ncbi:hypothetical protein J3459_010646 [Metarhizium acridum]|nr:hypothetical protein J3459_010646 [Metarhizium acridum]
MSLGRQLITSIIKASARRPFGPVQIVRETSRSTSGAKAADKDQFKVLAVSTAIHASSLNSCRAGGIWAYGHMGSFAQIVPSNVPSWKLELHSSSMSAFLTEIELLFCLIS